jgi:transposase
MKLHGNAALSWRGRRQLAERVVVEGWTLAAAAEAAGISVRCCRKWAGRYRLEGEAGLLDRSSAPRRVANRTPQERVEVIVALRSLRFTAAEIAETLAMALSTVSGILRRLGLGKLGRIGLEPPRRYERSRPGELVHVDVKRLGRIQGGAGKRVRDGLHKHYNPARIDLEGRRRLTVGWEFVHIAIDDHSRLAYAEVLPDEKAATAIGFLRRARALLRPLRDQSRAALDRQRAGLRLRGPRSRLPRARHPPSAHPSLPATDERQGRALHPHPARRLGLRRRLRLKRRTHGRP